MSLMLCMHKPKTILLIDIEVSRLAVVYPCLFKIIILCDSPRPKSG